MPISIGTKNIKGHKYYYARECKRVLGKPRIVWQKYLGKAEAIVQAVENANNPPEPDRAIISEFGAVAALFDIAKRLQLVDTIDAHVQKRQQGLSVGHYMLVAAINRCVCPKSKARIGQWFESTPLRRLIPADKSHLSSQRFWDNMSKLDADTIVKIEHDLVTKLVSEFQVDTRCLLFDATNFFTFIDSFNENPTLAQRGNSKEKRKNLRIVGLALLASLDFHIPLFHDTYPGNRNDAKEFQSVTETLVQRHQALTGDVENITVVFDKGNNSAQNIEALDESPFHFVGSLKLNQCPDLLTIPLERYKPLHHSRLSGVRAYRDVCVVFGQSRTVVLTYNEQLYLSQTQSLLNELRKRTRNLDDLVRKLEKRRSGEVRGGRKPTVASVQQQALNLLKGQHVKEIVRFEVSQCDGCPQLTYHVDHQELHRIAAERFGKTLLFTDNDSWTDDQVILAYRGQAGVEECFKIMKDPHFVSWSPMFHWTDDKIRVHAFYCVIALMLVSLLRRELHQAGLKLSIERTIEELNGIQEIAISYPPVGGNRRPPHLTLSEMSKQQQQMFDSLDLKRYLAVKG